MARVHVLNTTDATIALRLNGAVAGTVPPGGLDPEVGFRPGRLELPRDIGPAAHFGEENTLEVLVGGRTTVYRDVAIDPARVPPGRDLELYLFRSAAILAESGRIVWGAADAEAEPHLHELYPSERVAI